jgi:hypothetical protein
MKRILAVAGVMILGLIAMDNQVVTTPSGLAVVRAGQALAADMPARRPRLSPRQLAREKHPLAKAKARHRQRRLLPEAKHQ